MSLSHLFLTAGFKEVQVLVCVFIAALQGPFTQNLNVFPQSCENSIHVLPPHSRNRTIHIR